MNPEAHWPVSLAELVSSRLLKDTVSKIGGVGVKRKQLDMVQTTERHCFKDRGGGAVKRKELDMVTRVHNPISRESDRWVPGTRWPAGSS